MMFDTDQFLKFFFSVTFLFVCCFILILYLNRAVAVVLNIILRYCILPPRTMLHVGSFVFSPLHARILFKNLFYQNENLSIRIVDGYITFAFWDTGRGKMRWASLRDYMLSPELIGTRCRVNDAAKHTRSVIVGVDVENQKVMVRTERDVVADSGNDDDVELAERPGLPRVNDPDRSPSNSSGEDYSTTFAARGNDMAGGVTSPFNTRRERFAPYRLHIGVLTDSAVDHDAEGATLKTYDSADVKVLSKPDCCRLHINGMRLCVYNATGKYHDLTANEQSIKNLSTKVVPKVYKLFQQRFRVAPTTEDTKAAPVSEVNGLSATSSSRGATGRRGEPSMMSLDDARLLQKRQLSSRSLLQRFFSFFGGVEVEVFGSSIDLGGAGSSHPYFLHTTFQRGEGRVYLTRDTCPSIDLYRSVMELTLQHVDARMAQMDSKLTENQVLRNSSLRDRAQVMFHGISGLDLDVKDNKELPHLIRDFGILMNAEDNNTVHLVLYRDAPNVYAGESITRDTPLPTSGIEVLLDVKKIRYGPWTEYCRTQMWQYFFPPNYKPIEALPFVVGQPRPHAGTEYFVETLRELIVEVPFKRRCPSPSPPFGIRDSGHRGCVRLCLGEGSQYIQRAQYMLPEDEKQNFESLFMARDMTIWANSVLDRDTVLCRTKSLQLFIDRQDDSLWNGRRLMNILPKLRGTEVYWYMCYIDFFMDLLSDWQYAPHMYHGVPLATEVFNTTDRAVRDFVPNVKRLEVFCDGFLTLYFNANTNNVVYSEDVNDKQLNSFIALKVHSGQFVMTLPHDSYQLSYRNEVVRPMKLHAQTIQLHLLLPPSHPLADFATSEAPFGQIDFFDLSGAFTINTPNQSVPLDRCHVNPATGRSRLTDFLDLDMTLTGLRGTVLGSHIKYIVNVFQNTFMECTRTIRPSELFWLLAKLQSHATTGKNRRKEFTQYLESSGPGGNDVELCVLVRLNDVEVSCTTGLAPSCPRATLTTGVLTFSYVKQFAVTDMALTISPITVRLMDQVETLDKPEAKGYVCVGAVTLGMVKHFGPMPYKPKFHESTEVVLDGVAFEMSMEQMVQLVHLVQGVRDQMQADDTYLLEEVADALAMAEETAEQIWNGSARRAVAVDRHRAPVLSVSDADAMTACHDVVDCGGRSNTSAPMFMDSSSLDFLRGERTGSQAYESQAAFCLQQGQPQVSSGGERSGDSGRSSVPHERRIAATVEGYAPTVDGSISLEVVIGFAREMEKHNLADDESKDYGLVFMTGRVTNVFGTVQITPGGYLTLGMSKGLCVASTTLNDANSNKRQSAAADDVTLRALVSKSTVVRTEPPSASSSASNEDYIEVFSVEVPIALRQYVAYPCDGGLAAHMRKQQQFVQTNDYEHLLNFVFPDAASSVDDMHAPSPLGRVSATAVVSNSTPPPTTREPSTVPRLSCPAQQTFFTPLNSHIQCPGQSPLGVLSSSAVSAARELILPESTGQRASSEDVDKTAQVGVETSVLHETAQPTDEESLVSPTMDSANLTQNLSLPFLIATDAVNTDLINVDPSSPDEGFRTCVSATNFSDEGASGMSDWDDDGSGTEWGGIRGGGPSVSPKQMPANYDVHPNIPLLCFYRTFSRRLPVDGEPTVLDYLAPVGGARRSVRGSSSRAHFHAPLPSSAFAPVSMSDCHVPEYIMANAMLGTGSGEDPLVWARRCADNEERSKHGSTSRHLHVETTQPVTVWVTKEALSLAALALLALAEVSSRMERHPAPTKRADPMRSGNARMPSPRNHHSDRRHRKMAKRSGKSRARSKQMLWLPDDQIYSVVLPCIEAKFLAELPAPAYNWPTEVPVQGVYCATWAICGLQLVLWENRPPTGVEGLAVHRKQLSASLNLSSMGVVTQIEYEPIVREGNLSVDVPRIAYDQKKDTTAVIYMTEMCGRGKRSMVRGAEGGACSISIGTLAAHLTRDFVDYCIALYALLQELMKDVLTDARSQSLLALWRGSRQGGLSLSMRASVVEGQATYMNSTPIGFHSTLNELPFADVGAPAMPRPDSSHVVMDSSRAIQGKAHVQMMRVVLVDSRKDGRCMRVDTANASCIEIGRPSANFSVRIPGRRKTKALLVQFVGEVELFRVKLYPSILHIVGPRSPEMKNDGRPSAAADATASKPSDVGREQNAGEGNGRRGLTAAVVGVPIRLVYEGTFMLRTLDVSLLYSDMNYLQLKGKTLTGCAASRGEGLCSRECVQMGVLTEVITPRLKERLCAWARRARVRAKGSRYAACPTTTEQLQLLSTASFFAQQLEVQYVADAILTEKPVRGLVGEPGDDGAIDSRVLMAGLHNVGIVTQMTEQFDLSGNQLNVHVEVRKVSMRLPYRPEASNTIQPQAYKFVHAWWRAVRAVSHSVYQRADAMYTRQRTISLGNNRPLSVTIDCHSLDMEAVVGLERDVTQQLRLPEISVFLRSSPDGCMNVKAHVHPFTLALRSPLCDNYVVTLPNIFFISQHDAIRLTASVMVQTVALTVTPLFVHHTLRTYDRLVNEYVPALTHPVPEETSLGNTTAYRTNHRRGSGAEEQRSRRCVVLVLLEGLRVSYLTSMTNLRLVVRQLNATADTSQAEEQKLLHWVVNVTGAQVALVDRDDHDHMTATAKSMVQGGCAPIVSQETPKPPSGRPPKAPAIFNSSITISRDNPAADGSQRQATENATRFIATRPLGGYVWGSVELSFTLSSGRVGRSAAITALNNLTPNMQRAVADRLEASVTRWELAIHSPVVVLRVGLDVLLGQSIQETQAFISSMKEAAAQQQLTFHVRLDKLKTFQRLHTQRKRLAARAARWEEASLQHLCKLTERAASVKMRRRGGHAVPNEENELTSALDVTTEVKFTAHMTDLMVVVPFGDAVYRSLLEELPDIFHCDQGGYHVHSSLCLSRQHCVPTMAAKCMVEDTAFICEAVSTVHLLSRMPSLRQDNSFGKDQGQTVGDFATTRKFCGRFSMTNTYAFVTEGTPLQATVPTAAALLNTTSILGGLGCLTYNTRAEPTRSLNRIFIASVEAPLRIVKHHQSTEVGAVVDLSAPQVRVSSHLIGVVGQFAKELPTVTLQDVHRRHHGAAVHRDPSRNVNGESQTHDSSSSALSHSHSPPIHIASAAKAFGGVDTPLHIDVSARLEAGTAAIFARGTDEEATGSLANHTDTKFGRKAPGASRRRVAFDIETLAAHGKPDTLPPFADAGPAMRELLSLPLPSVVVQMVRQTSYIPHEKHDTVVRAEMRAGMLELNPSILSLARDMEGLITCHERALQSRAEKTLLFAEHIESLLPWAPARLHCSLVDILLPMPRTFADALAKSRVSSGIKHYDAAASRCRSLSRSLEVRRSPVRPTVPNVHSFTVLHFNMCNSRLRLSSDTNGSTAFTISIEDTGTVDLIITCVSRPCDNAFVSQYPSMSMLFQMHRLRIDCRTKLEAKSLDIFLPEAEVCLSRRQGAVGSVISIAANLPFVPDGSEANLTLHMPHMAQIFSISQLWLSTAREALLCGRRVFSDGQPARGVVQHMRDIPLGQRLRHRAENLVQRLVKDERVMATLRMTQGLARVDMGFGNTQQLTLGNLIVAGERNIRAQGGSTMLLKAKLSTVSVSSEGVLSGEVNIGNVVLQAFLIENVDGCLSFSRSVDGRTFREWLQIQRVHVAFKERQLKDVFECKVDDFRVIAMDGVGEEGYNMINAEVLLSHSTLGVTPSTVPAFLAFVRGASNIISVQKRLANEKLKDHPFIRSLRGAWKVDRAYDPEGSVAGDSRSTTSVPFQPSESPPPAMDLVELEAAVAEKPLPFMGNRLTHIPCGQLRVTVEDSILLLGAISSGEAATGCVVASCNRAGLSFAECPAEGYTKVKKILVMETKHLVLYRPGVPRAVIMGLRGSNVLHFYTMQALGEPNVEYALSLEQTHPWTGNPRFQDFEELHGLFRSFTDRRNAEVFSNFGKSDMHPPMPPAESQELVLRHTPVSHHAPGTRCTSPVNFTKGSGSPSFSGRQSPTAQHAAEGTLAEPNVMKDGRQLIACQTSKFSPHLRFGGGVSVNMEVILNWMGVTEKMLPKRINEKLSDPLEKVVYNLSIATSERTVSPSP